MLFELPFVVIKVLLWSCILYFAVYFQYTASQFFFFVLVAIFLADLGTAMAQLFAALARTIDMAASAMTTFPLLFTVFSGFFIHASQIPPFWIWAYYISFANYAVSALSLNEWVGNYQYTQVASFCANMTVCPTDMPINPACKSYVTALPPTEILTSLGAPTSGLFSSRWTNFAFLVIIWAVFRIGAYAALRWIRHEIR